MATDYRKLDTLPAYVQRTDGNADNRTLIKWSGDAPPPVIGDLIRVKVNSIGNATVKGYFVEGGWLGVLYIAHKPPAWYVKQNGKDCIAHAFGIEIGDIL